MHRTDWSIIPPGYTTVLIEGDKLMSVTEERVVGLYIGE